MELCFISLDVALSHTGFAIFALSTGNFSFRLLKIGVIDTDTQLDLDTRVRIILTELERTVASYGVQSFFIEEPPMTLYGKKLPRNILIGRAASTFKVFASCYAVVGYCFSKDLFCRTIFPSTWQNGSGFKDSGYKDTKKWSIDKANTVIRYLKFQHRELKSLDEHAADAINIGIFAIEKMQQGKWVVPYCHEDYVLMKAKQDG